MHPRCDRSIEAAYRRSNPRRSRHIHHVRDRDEVLKTPRPSIAHSSRQCRLGHPVRRQRQYRCRGDADDGGLPRFCLRSTEDAFVVQRLRRPARSIGKTNLDQFATGLPVCEHLIPRPAMRSIRKSPGGSSSAPLLRLRKAWSASRCGPIRQDRGVPAALNGIVGLKPSLGALSNRRRRHAGRWTAYRYCADRDDAFEIFISAAVKDPRDAYARAFPAFRPSGKLSQLRVGVPSAETIRFFGDDINNDPSIIVLRRFAKMGRLLPRSTLNLSCGGGTSQRPLGGGAPYGNRSAFETNRRRSTCHRQVTEVALGFSATILFARCRLRESPMRSPYTMASVDLLCVPSILRLLLAPRSRTTRSVRTLNLEPTPTSSIC